MASNGYDFVLTKTAEADFDEALTYISEVTVLYYFLKLHFVSFPVIVASPSLS